MALPGLQALVGLCQEEGEGIKHDVKLGGKYINKYFTKINAQSVLTTDANTEHLLCPAKNINHILRLIMI